MVVESSCDEGGKGGGLNRRRNRVRGLVGKHARARLAICPFSASAVAKAARCLHPSRGNDLGEVFRDNYNYRTLVRIEAVVMYKAEGSWSQVRPLSCKKPERTVQSETHPASDNTRENTEQSDQRERISSQRPEG